jgi:hypothetical protein
MAKGKNGNISAPLGNATDIKTEAVAHKEEVTENVQLAEPAFPEVVVPVDEAPAPVEAVAAEPVQEPAPVEAEPAAPVAADPVPAVAPVDPVVSPSADEAKQEEQTPAIPEVETVVVSKAALYKMMVALSRNQVMYYTSFQIKPRIGELFGISGEEDMQEKWNEIRDWVEEKKI